jgi:hypothetical protein
MRRSGARLPGILASLLLAACASSPPPTAATAGTSSPSGATAADTQRPPPPPGQTRYTWSKASEADVAAVLDKKFEAAAKKFVKLKRNDQVMFCKRYRDLGSMIPTIHCITEAELRKQVEDSIEVRQQMRNRVGKCDITSGCQGG